ncbi:hypothetical protein V6N13_094780 [Hibiscus sabdariffa]
MCKCRSHGTFPLFGLQSSHLNICYYHQDLHRRPLRPGSRPGFYGDRRALLLIGAWPLPRRPGIGHALKRHPFSGLVDSAVLLTKNGPLGALDSVARLNEAAAPSYLFKTPWSVFQDGPDGEPAGRRPEHAGAEARRDGACWVPRSRRRRLHGRIKGPGLGRHHDPRRSTPRADRRTGSRRSTSDRGASPAPIRFPPDNFKHSLTLFSKSFSSFPRGTCSLSVSRPYLALDGIYRPIRAAFPNNPTRRQRLVVRQGPGTTGLSPSPAPLSRGLGPGPSLRTLLQTTIRTPRATDSQAGLFPVRSPLLRESLFSGLLATSRAANRPRRRDPNTSPDPFQSACFEHSNFFKVTAPEERPGQLRPGAHRRSRDEQTGAHREGGPADPPLDLPSNGSSLRDLDCTHSNYQTRRARVLLFIVTTSPCQDWVICAPAAFLDVVAVSQAPSPESNPNSPSPVTTIVGHYPTIES